MKKVWLQPPNQPIHRRHQPSDQRGVTLIELLIALAFGLVLILATLSVYLANSQTFRQVENLSRINENARIAFELMGREFRGAGSKPCGNTQVATVSNDSSIGAVIIPYGSAQVMPTKAFGTGAAARATATDAVIVSGIDNDLGIRVVEHNLTTSKLKLNKMGDGFAVGDNVLACDFNFATIFKVTEVIDADLTLAHNTGIAPSGNCTKILYKPGEQVGCSTTSGGAKIEGATLVKVISTSWYVAQNGRGGRSLYRIRSNNTPEEMVENITDMQIEYLVADAVNTEPFDYVISSDYSTTTPRPIGVTTGNYAWWPTNFNIVALRVTLTLETANEVGTDGNTITRQMTSVFSLRNQTS